MNREETDRGSRVTEKYTPEKVAELVAEARDYLDRECNVSQYPNLVSQLADALTAVSAERDEAWRVASEQTRMERDRAEASEADLARAREVIEKAKAMFSEDAPINESSWVPDETYRHPPSRTRQGRERR